MQVHSSKGASAASSPPKKKRTHKKQNNGYDASNEPIGFERGYEAEEIIGATDLDSQIMFNIKWLVFPVDYNLSSRKFLPSNGDTDSQDCIRK